MKKKKVHSTINLEKMAGGAFAEKLNEALAQVAENIINPNTAATAKRGITVNIKFAPSKTRQLVSTSISVTTKLAATEAIDAQMVMGMNMRTGEIEIAEYGGQIDGQMTIQDYEQPDEEPNEAEPEQPQVAPPADGKPIDLRNRGKKQEPVMVAGRDYDPDTGEVVQAAGQVVELNKNTRQA